MNLILAAATFPLLGVALVIGCLLAVAVGIHMLTRKPKTPPGTGAGGRTFRSRYGN